MHGTANTWKDFTPHHNAPRPLEGLHHSPHSPHHTTPQPYSLQSPYSPRNAVHGQLVHSTPQDVLERLTQSTAHSTEQTTTAHSLNHSSNHTEHSRVHRRLYRP